MQLESLFSTYLDAYASKNEQAIAHMFAENITLRDWQIAVSGKVAALKETRQNFQAAESIAIKILFKTEFNNLAATGKPIKIEMIGRGLAGGLTVVMGVSMAVAVGARRIRRLLPAHRIVLAVRIHFIHQNVLNE